MTDSLELLKPGSLKPVQSQNASRTRDEQRQSVAQPQTGMRRAHSRRDLRTKQRRSAARRRHERRADERRATDRRTSLRVLHERRSDERRTGERRTLERRRQDRRAVNDRVTAAGRQEVASDSKRRGKIDDYA